MPAYMSDARSAPEAVDGATSSVADVKREGGSEADAVVSPAPSEEAQPSESSAGGADGNKEEISESSKEKVKEEENAAMSFATRDRRANHVEPARTRAVLPRALDASPLRCAHARVVVDCTDAGRVQLERHLRSAARGA